MTHPDLGSASPEELAPLLGDAYAIALLLPVALSPRDHAHQRGTEGTEAALWLAGGVDPAYVADWLEGEAQILRASLTAPVAPPPPSRSDGPVNVCRECREGKHPNCDRTAWSDLTDMPVPCDCPDPVHQL